MTPLLVRRRDVEKIVGMSYSNFNRLEKEGKFPSRLKLGATRVVWDYAALVVWYNNFINSASHA